MWIPGYGLLAKPLSDATQALEWNGKQQQAFDNLKESFTSALPLGIQS
jgi:hypothetical protein